MNMKTQRKRKQKKSKDKLKHSNEFVLYLLAFVFLSGGVYKYVLNLKLFESECIKAANTRSKNYISI